MQLTSGSQNCTLYHFHSLHLKVISWVSRTDVQRDLEMQNVNEESTAVEGRGRRQNQAGEN